MILIDRFSITLSLLPQVI